MEEHDRQFIIVHGNPVDGFAFYGPFADQDTAIDYADSELDSDSWNVAELLQPGNG